MILMMMMMMMMMMLLLFLIVVIIIMTFRHLSYLLYSALTQRSFVSFISIDKTED